MSASSNDEVPDAVPLAVVQEAIIEEQESSLTQENGTIAVESILCKLCNENTNSPRCCDGCWQVWYCCRNHQISDWPKHKPSCKPYKISNSPELGRFLVATKPIRFGELILKDPNLIFGPKIITEPVCLACYKPVTGNYSCDKCGFPMCEETCALAEAHVPECTAVKDTGSKVNVSIFGQNNCMYECIVPLRILALRDSNPSIWRKILSLESHSERRRDTEVAAITQKTVVDIIKGRLNLSYNDEIIHQVLGIIDTNAFEIRLPDSSIMGVYGTGAMLEHSCVPNTHRTFDADLNLMIRASVDIKKGDHIQSCYTESLSTTLSRQEHLLTSKFFTCLCPRCLDPTELGTYTSAMLCPDCIKNKSAFLQKQKSKSEQSSEEIDMETYAIVLPDDPTSLSSPWKCMTCQSPLDSEYVTHMMSVINEEVDELDKTQSVDACEAFLDKWSSIIHPNHSAFLNVKYVLIHLYGSEDGYSLEEMSPLQLIRKEKLARDILKVADVIVPGISRLRGSVLYELYQSIFYKTCAMYQAGFMPDDMAKAMSQEAYDCLLQCARILSFEPPVQPEGQLGIQAKEELRNMMQWLQEEGWKG